ncbi:MAG: hypothetical protein V4669_11635 [Pseudomonadota bacterium]
MDAELTPSQWISACAETLAERWRTVPARELEEVAIVIWQDEALRSEPPREAAIKWLGPVNVGQSDSGRAAQQPRA